MSSVRPIYISVYDKGFVRRATISMPKFATIVMRHNDVGTATIGVLASDPALARCIEDGARLVIRDENRQHLMSGPIVRWRGTGPSKRALFELDVEDDFRILKDVLGWVQPSEPITNQGIAGTNWTMTGPAETVLKAAVTANAVNRLGLPLTVAPNQGRGSTIKASLRFHPLYDRLFPVVDGAGIDAAGIGVTVRQDGAGLRLDCYTPSTYPRKLTESAGIITEWSVNRHAPTATRVVVGGQGEAQVRVFRHIERVPTETAWGIKVERFRDARDVEDNLVLYERGEQTLDEGAAKSGIAVTLSQTPNFRYGSAVKVGDVVTLRVGPGIELTETLKEATLSWTRDDGWKATPRVGEKQDDPTSALSKAVRSIARYLSSQNRT